VTGHRDRPPSLSPLSSPLKILPAAECMRQRSAIDEFEFAAERHAMREPRRAHSGLARYLREQMRRRLAFDGGIRGNDQLAHFAFAEPRGEKIQAEFLRP